MLRPNSGCERALFGRNRGNEGATCKEPQARRRDSCKNQRRLDSFGSPCRSRRWPGQSRPRLGTHAAIFVSLNPWGDFDCRGEIEDCTIFVALGLIGGTPVNGSGGVPWVDWYSP
jgi:hypothetical protein